MNLRKTIAGAAVALGSTAVMLGLGGTAHASGVDVESTPNLDTELGKVGTLGKGIAGIDTTSTDGKLQALNGQKPDVKAVLERVDAQQVSSLLGYNKPERPSNVEAGLDF